MAQRINLGIGEQAPDMGLYQAEQATTPAQSQMELPSTGSRLPDDWFVPTNREVPNAGAVSETDNGLTYAGKTDQGYDQFIDDQGVMHISRPRPTPVQSAAETGLSSVVEDTPIPPTAQSLFMPQAEAATPRFFPETPAERTDSIELVRHRDDRVELKASSMDMMRGHASHLLGLQENPFRVLTPTVVERPAPMLTQPAEVRPVAQAIAAPEAEVNEQPEPTTTLDELLSEQTKAERRGLDARQKAIALRIGKTALIGGVWVYGMHFTFEKFREHGLGIFWSGGKLVFSHIFS